jgi:DNA-binding response OmpR family regulator
MSGTPTLLLVEDDPHIRLFVSEFLREDGYAVIEVADGKKAIGVLREHRPPVDGICLVILDMMLPEASGLDVLHELAALGNYTPVIAMSADLQQLRRATAAGADDTLAKPFDLDRLMEVVERVCDP